VARYRQLANYQMAKDLRKDTGIKTDCGKKKDLTWLYLKIADTIFDWIVRKILIVTLEVLRRSQRQVGKPGSQLPHCNYYGWGATRGCKRAKDTHAGKTYNDDLFYVEWP
jgi:hypothetical protein